MRRLATYFLRGLVVIAPVAVTIYICWLVFDRVDRWIGLPIPGAGFVITLAIITFVGFLASNLVTRSFIAMLERAMQRLPLVRLLYNSTRDLLDAFVGEQRRFDKPVIVALGLGNHARMLGFVTAESLDRLGLPGQVAVYLPQSYAFAGHLLVVPAGQVQPLSMDSAEAMTFIVSGGVSSGASDQRLPPGAG